jgi:hypothetical protein
MSFFGEALRGAKAESAMVDPEYRGRGICSRLVERTLEDARERGLSVVWGFPNRQSWRIMERSGRMHIGGLHAYIKVLRRMRVFRAYLRKRWARSAHPSGAGAGRVGNRAGGRADAPAAESGRTGRFSPAEGPFDQRFERLWEGARDRLGITIERSPEYLRWRFQDNPHGRYLVQTCGPDGEPLSGYMIAALKQEGRLAIGYIVDLLSSEPDAGIFDDLLAGTLQQLNAAGADMVVFFLNPDHPLSAPLLTVLERRRFHRRSRPKPFSVKVFPEERRAGLEDCGDRWQRWHAVESWYLTGAFGEGVEY